MPAVPTSLHPNRDLPHSLKPAPAPPDPTPPPTPGLGLGAGLQPPPQPSGPQSSLSSFVESLRRTAASGPVTSTPRPAMASEVGSGGGALAPVGVEASDGPSSPETEAPGEAGVMKQEQLVEKESSELAEKIEKGLVAMVSAAQGDWEKSAVEVMPAPVAKEKTKKTSEKKGGRRRTDRLWELDGFMTVQQAEKRKVEEEQMRALVEEVSRTRDAMQDQWRSSLGVATAAVGSLSAEWGTAMAVITGKLGGMVERMARLERHVAAMDRGEWLGQKREELRHLDGTLASMTAQKMAMEAEERSGREGQGRAAGRSF